jgi:hypothetical protein
MQVVGGRSRDVGEELLELGLGVAPGEVGVRLLESSAREGVQHGRSGEGFGEEHHIRMPPAHLIQQPLPEDQRLGVRIVDPEDRDALADPELDDA